MCTERLAPVLSLLPSGDLLQFSQAIENNLARIPENIGSITGEEIKDPAEIVQKPFQFIAKWMDVHDPIFLANPAYRQLLSHLAAAHGAHFVSK